MSESVVYWIVCRSTAASRREQGRPPLATSGNSVNLIMFDADRSWDERILTEQFRY